MMWLENCRLSPELRSPQKLFKLLLSLVQRQTCQLLAIQFKQIESEELQRHARRNAGFQHGEVLATLTVDSDNLTVDQRRAFRQSLKRLNDPLELLCPIMAVAACR